MSNGSNPYVTRVTIMNGRIVLTIDANEFPRDAFIELSGYAIQNGETFANFYDVKPVTVNEDGTALLYAEATPTQGFKSGVPVTVVLRAARAWISVLKESAEYELPPGDKTAPDGHVWDTVETKGQVSASPWHAGSDS